MERLAAGEQVLPISVGPGARLPLPDREIGVVLADAHARDIVRARTHAKTGWTVACRALTPTPGHTDEFAEVKYHWEDFYLQQAMDDDFVGCRPTQASSVDADGVVPHPPSPTNTLTGWAFRPDALGIAIRNAADITNGTPILVTENGIAADDDERRFQYIGEALDVLFDATDDGIDVRGYLHWSATDTFEGDHWAPVFGLTGVDRTRLARTPRPSLSRLGDIARNGYRRAA
ncbi:family 1 glycosylhydrolase [Streptomyces sp. NPDC005921]|uniref:family 1 glycosylhydrolase n=1 Tax=Streptomyces sp. NPDC005827 TaxID=3157070 RepID=UPI0033E0FAF7